MGEYLKEEAVLIVLWRCGSFEGFNEYESCENVLTINMDEGCKI